MKISFHKHNHLTFGEFGIIDKSAPAAMWKSTQARSWIKYVLKQHNFSRIVNLLCKYER